MNAAQLNVASLLEPFADDDPIGRELNGRTYDPLLSELSSRVTAARNAEKLAINPPYDDENRISPPPQDPWISSSKQWQSVVELIDQTLGKVSKDLMFASRLPAALLRTDRLKGFQIGLGVIEGLADRYWSAMVTRAAHARLAPGTADDEKLAAAQVKAAKDLLEIAQFVDAPVSTDMLDHLPLTGAAADGPYTYLTYMEAVSLESRPADQERKYSLAKVRESIAATARSEPGFYPSLWEQLECIEQAASQLSAVMTKVSGQTFTLSSLKRRCDLIKKMLLHVAAAHVTPAQPASAEAASGTNGEASAATGLAHSSDGPRQRDEAFEQLSRIADFFARTEPLSLLAEQIRLVVQRGRLPPAQYFEELIQDVDVRKAFFRVVGIKSEERTSE